MILISTFVPLCTCSIDSPPAGEGEDHEVDAVLREATASENFDLRQARSSSVVSLTYKTSLLTSEAIKVFPPDNAAASTSPKLVIYLGGTNVNATQSGRQIVDESIAGLRRSGFTVAAVDYANGIFDAMDCRALERKARMIFSSSDSSSAYRIIAQAIGLPVGTSFAVMGHSQGSWVAGLGRKFNSNIKVALLTGTGLKLRFFANENFQPCLPASVKKVEHVLAITGEEDFVYQGLFSFQWSAREMAGQLSQLTGYRGVDNDGRDRLGNGWYVVLNEETSDRKADHDFFNGADHKFDPYFLRDDVPWSLPSQLKWIGERL